MPALSYVESTANGTQTDFDFSALDLFIDIPKKDQIKVYVNGQLQVYTTNYTVVGDEVQFVGASTPANGTMVKIARETKIDDRLVNFTNSSILTAADLNKNTDQLLFLAQELDDTVTNIALTTAGSIADGAITAAKLSQVSGEEAVVTNAIRDGAVQAAKLATDAVTTNKILNLAVTTGKINDLAVTTGKIDNLAVTGGKIAANTITTDKFSSSFYETGTWIPEFKYVNSLITALNSTTFTYGNRYGYYTKIGNVVNYWAYIAGTLQNQGDATASSNFAFTLPPTANAVNNYMGTTMVYTNGFSLFAPTSALIYFFPVGMMGVFFKQQATTPVNSTSGLTYTDAGFSGEKTVILYGSYRLA